MFKKNLELKTKKIVESLYVGNYKTNFKGNGLEFIDFKEYDILDNSKNIDFLRSEIAGKTLLRLYEEKRDLSVYFIVDLEYSFFEKYLNNKTKFELLLECFYLVGFSAIKSGDKFGGILNYEKNKIFPAKKGKQNFVNIIKYLEKINSEINMENNFVNKIKNIFSDNKKIEFKNNLQFFNNLKIKNSLVFYFTDRLELSDKDLKIISTKNDLIFCNIFNSFENNLSGEGVISIDNSNLKIDLNNKKKIEEYNFLRKEKINNLRKKIHKFGGKYILIDETKNLYKEFNNLFKN